MKVDPNIWGTDPNAPAFACPTTEEFGGSCGLSTRDYFASAAMATMADWTVCDSTIRGIAETAVKYADALIEALNAEKKE